MTEARTYETECSFFGSLKESFPGGSEVKNLPANVGETDSIPRSERSPGDRNDNPLQYSCQGNSTDRGVWQESDCGIAKSRT